MPSYITVQKGGNGRYEEKKSVFLGEIRHVVSEEEALAFVRDIKKKHYDARHHCYAYRIGRTQPDLHASDDGEPSGTAGRPILNVLAGADVTDAVLVVTRYFGGTLLGTGGLVRAYTSAARDCLKQSVLVERRQGIRILLTAAYPDVGRIRHMTEERGIQVISSTYTERVQMECVLPEEDGDAFIRKITDLTSGRTETEKTGLVWYDSRVFSAEN